MPVHTLEDMPLFWIHRAFTGIVAENEAAKEQNRRNAPNSAESMVAQMHAGTERSF